jgi:hypothetical protein
MGQSDTTRGGKFLGLTEDTETATCTDPLLTTFEISSSSVLPDNLR